MTAAFDRGRCPPIELRHRLRIAREWAGYDQGELADTIGISRNSVGNAETGAGTPRRATVNAWALACGVPAKWIWTGQPPADNDEPNSGLRIISLESRRKARTLESETKVTE